LADTDVSTDFQGEANSVESWGIWWKEQTGPMNRLF
jgi:hypothetical protein